MSPPQGTQSHSRLTRFRQANNHLDAETWSLVTDCVPSAYCAEDGTCQPKRCRKDIVGHAAELSLLCLLTVSSHSVTGMCLSINSPRCVVMATCKLRDSRSLSRN